MPEDIYIDVRGCKEINDGVISVDRNKAYQMAICILTTLAMTDTAIGANGDNDMPPPPISSR